MIDGMPEYEVSEEYGVLGADIITEKLPWILAAGISIGFLASTKEKKRGKTKKILGDCTKVPERWKPYCPHDFVITIYETSCIGMTDDQLRILIWHELQHVGMDDKGKYYVRPHDVEDFDDILNIYGMRWADVM